MSTWISVVDESPPIEEEVKCREYSFKKTIEVLCAVIEDNKEKKIKIGYCEIFDNGTTCWITPGLWDEVTHWMMLPEYPK